MSDHSDEDILARISEINASFATGLDQHDVEFTMNLFTPDAQYTSGSRRLMGHDEIKSFLIHRQNDKRVTRHFFSGLRVKRESQTVVTSTSTWMSFAGAGGLPIQSEGPAVVADFEDRYQLCDDGKWRICVRTIKPVFVTANARALPASHAEASS